MPEGSPWLSQSSPPHADDQTISPTCSDSPEALYRNPSSHLPLTFSDPPANAVFRYITAAFASFYVERDAAAPDTNPDQRGPFCHS